MSKLFDTLMVISGVISMNYFLVNFKVNFEKKNLQMVKKFPACILFLMIGDKKKNNQFFLIDSSIWFVLITLGWFNVHIKGWPVKD